MSLVEGELIAIDAANGECTGTLRVGGALTRISLLLVPEARVGDILLAHAGVALARVRPEGSQEEARVSRHTG